MKFKSDAELEHQREIVCLQKTQSGSYSLRVNEVNCEKMTTDESDTKVPVLSFLGNTTAGKSFIIKALMGMHEASPFCFDEDRMCSTTANANMFSSTNIIKNNTRVNIIDFEGENGLSPFMDMVRM